MDTIIKDPGSEFDPGDNTPQILFAVFSLIAAMYFTLVFYVDDEWIGFKDITIGNAKSILEFFAHAGSSGRQFMVLAGFISSIPFFVSFLIYIHKYVDILWNPFFVNEGDKFKLYITQVGVAIMMVIFSIFPHYWYVGVIIIDVFIILFLRRRKIQIQNKILYSNIYAIKDGIVYVDSVSSGEIEPDLTVIYIAISYIYVNFLVKSLYYSFPVIGMLWFCHLMRGFDSGRLEMLFSGAYFGISCFFSAFATIGMYIRWTHSLPAMADRIRMNDHEYFRRLAR